MKMTLIDTHSHIYATEFNDDNNVMIARAKNEGLSQILMPAIDASTHTTMLALEAQYPQLCLSMMGLHPCSVKGDFNNELAIVEKYLQERKFIAIGETGLDFYWDRTFSTQQYIAFRRQIEWAIVYNVPVVIHSRNSTNECIEVIKEYQRESLKGVFHCFSGSEEQARKVVDLGFYLGIGGVVTFKNSGLDKVVEQFSLEHVVLETDAPYLAPVPFRGKRNEPSYLKYVVKRLSEIKRVSEEEVASITTANAKKLFGI